MKDSHHTIFRPDALQRYSSGRQAPVFPRLVSPPVFMCLWVVLALLLAGGIGAWFFKVPIYVTGTATVVKRTNGEIVIAAFFPPEQLPRVRAGQTLSLSSGGGGVRLFRTIVTVNPEITSPEAAGRQFASLTGAAHPVREPSAVAIADPQASMFGFPAAAYRGSTLRAEVEVGSQRVILLLLGGIIQ